MITSWDIYWITRLDSASFVLAAVFIISIIAIVVLLIARACLAEPYYAWEKKFNAEWLTPLKITLAMAMLSGFISLFIPTTKEFAAIYLIPKIANNEQVQKIPDNATRLLNAKLEQWIDDITKKKENKK